jgi:Dynamin-like helical domain
VVGRLRELIDLSDEEVDQLSIVAVAANPFLMGTEHWLANLDQFRTLSHIASLQDATLNKIKASGGAAQIVEDARRSVIADVLGKQLPIAIANDERFGAEVGRLGKMRVSLERQLRSADGQISDVRIRLREFVSSYFGDLILQTKGLTLETFGEIFEREIGAEGIVLVNRLQNEFDRQLRGVNQEIGRMRLSVAAEIEHFNSTVVNLGKQGLSYVVKSRLITNSTVLATRDTIVAAAKTIGVDLGGMLKFKSWGAVKLANGLNGALAILGIAFEVWDSYAKFQRERAFK